MSNWNKVFKPIVVLCAICVVVTAALAATNQATAPVIAAAFTPDGTIRQLKVTDNKETKGIGSNVASSASYWEKYAGLSAEKALVLKTDVDAYSGATISSKALNAAVNAAIEAYNMIP